MEGNELFRARHARAIVFKSTMRDVAWLSNFWRLEPPLSAALIGAEPRPFATVEHYYQAAKALHVGLPALAEAIRAAATPEAAKRLGGGTGMAEYVDAHRADAALVDAGVRRAVEGALGIGDKRRRRAAIKAALRGALDGFDDRGVMLRALRLKFDPSRDAALAARLVDTGDAALGESRGRSENKWAINRAGDAGLLGELLMQRRAELRAACDTCGARLAAVQGSGTCSACERGAYCNAVCFAAHACAPGT